MMASPMQIRMALFYYTRPEGEVFEDGNVRGGNFSCQFHQELAANGLIEWDEDGGCWTGVNDALAVYDAALCAVPFPVKTWSIPTPDEKG